MWQGACVAGGMCGRAICVVGGVRGGGGMRGRKNGNYSGRYASYWNAFLLFGVVWHFAVAVTTLRAVCAVDSCLVPQIRFIT